MIQHPIRPAVAGDLRDIAALIDRAIRISNAPEYTVREQMAVLADYSLPALGRLLASASLFAVAEMALKAGGAPETAGAIAVSPVRRREGGELAVINALFVDPLAQGMGVGGALVDEAVLRLKRKEAHAIAVSASLSAAGFYAHMGFSRVGSGRATSGVEIVRMERRLA